MITGLNISSFSRDSKCRGFPHGQNKILVNLQEMMQSNLSLICGNQVQQPFQSPGVSAAFETRNYYPDTFSGLADGHCPSCPAVPESTESWNCKGPCEKMDAFPEVRLPRRVEESLRQLMPNPPLVYQTVYNQPVSFVHNNTSHFSVEKCGTICTRTGVQVWPASLPRPSGFLDGALRTEQRHLYQQIPSHKALALPSSVLQRN